MRFHPAVHTHPAARVRERRASLGQRPDTSTRAGDTNPLSADHVPPAVRTPKYVYARGVRWKRLRTAFPDAQHLSAIEGSERYDTA